MTKKQTGRKKSNNNKKKPNKQKKEENTVLDVFYPKKNQAIRNETSEA